MWGTSPEFCQTTAEQCEAESQFVAVPSLCTHESYLKKHTAKNRLISKTIVKTVIAALNCPPNLPKVKTIWGVFHNEDFFSFYIETKTPLLALCCANCWKKESYLDMR